MAQSMPPLQVHRTLWGALLISQLLFLVVLNVVPAQDVAPEPSLLPLLGFMALSTAVMSLLLPRILFKKGVQALSVEKQEAPDPDAPPGFNKTITVAKNPAALEQKLLQLYTTRVILACALAEAVSLFGFVLKFLGFEWLMVIPFFVVGVALTLLQFPNGEAYLSDAEAALGFKVQRK